MRWNKIRLEQFAQNWWQQLRVQNRHASERSGWWSFLFNWELDLPRMLQDFIGGQYRISPLQRYHFKDETVDCWCYADRLVLRWLLALIKPVFTHLVSHKCLHLQGPSGVQTATRHLRNVLNTKTFRYIIRTDIKNYYAAIQHRILLPQVHACFDDPRVRNYLEAIITAPIDKGGVLLRPTQGIPRRSSLSPFFGALYLTPLDRAFEKKTTVFYLRYMDDIIILAENKNQYLKARKQLFNSLNALKLRISPHKTRMGKITDGFHFLGVQFAVSRNLQTKTQDTTCRLHDRSCRRATDKVRDKKEDAVHPANMRCYLVRWAS